MHNVDTFNALTYVFFMHYVNNRFYKQIFNFLEVFIKFLKIKEFVLTGIIALFLLAGCNMGAIDSGSSSAKFKEPVYTAIYKPSGDNFYTVYIGIEDHSSDKKETQPVKHNFFIRGGKVSSDFLFREASAKLTGVSDIGGGDYPTIHYKLHADSYHVGVMSEDPYGNITNIVWKLAERVNGNGNGTRITITDLPADLSINDSFCEIWLSKNANPKPDEYVAIGSNSIKNDTAIITMYSYFSEDWNAQTGAYYIFAEYNGVQKKGSLTIVVLTDTKISWEDLEPANFYFLDYF